MNGGMHSSSHKHRPELHITAETGVLEAPAGAVFSGNALHVFHQFRPRPSEGSRWAHQVASEATYDWDICDDVVVPNRGLADREGTARGAEVDILAGATVPVGLGAELFFVVTHAAGEATAAEARGADIPHGQRGPRTFTIERALIPNLMEATEVSDDPSLPDPHVQRLGAIDIDDSSHPVENLVTPSVIRHEDPAHPDEGWLMIALSLINDVDAQIVVLRSSDRQHWRVLGPLELPAEAALRPDRPFAPRIVSMVDADSSARRDVLFVTFPGGAGESDEVAGYVVGNLSGNAFKVTTPFTVIDFGHDFTRPRVIDYHTPVMFGLVGAHPSLDGQWANCLSAPRYLSLVGGELYQDVVGAPTAVRTFSDYAFIWSAQLDAQQGSVDVDVTDDSGQVIATISYTNDAVSVTRLGVDTRTAPLKDADSDTLTVFLDGPVCEVFADGGAVTLTSAIPAHSQISDIDVRATGGAKIISSMQTAGRHLMRMQAGLTSPEDQEAYMAEALIADRDVAAGIFDED